MDKSGLHDQHTLKSEHPNRRQRRGQIIGSNKSDHDMSPDDSHPTAMAR